MMTKQEMEAEIRRLALFAMAFISRTVFEPLKTLGFKI